MKNILLIVGAAAFAAAAPAAAKPGHAKGHGNAKHAKYFGYAGACPPGLAKHDGHCMPHGQYKKMYKVGQRYNTRYGNVWAYNQIPYDLRTQYGFQPDYNYYYGNGYLYQVDPRTQLIRAVVNAILR
ncbi:hypothetical protein H9L13_11880 [Sphingomonas lutea]|uniref:RcnB family protein n=1 Tax=Sphingomonas lutea TaxID=1045317 RepID=A0A7G9SHG5_9SPHN|nr:hypothetical protein [Sphingomonas lutea]QNN67290.1 hypothetical protein H9L13_11880 [Sphingomonas lutea]